ncbi:MAG: DNRLRE domain-containing protein, partial [Deltaproteobacteria bacterium]|nr:DNRLRE domain-containing protein [Deltaproteobacteria bacterium]
WAESSAQAVTLRIPAEADTYIDEISPDRTFGQKWRLLVNGTRGEQAHGLLRFDLNSVPETAVVLAATVTFMVHSGGTPDPYYVYPLLRDWDAGAATWNSAAAATPWYSPGGDYDPNVFAAAALSQSASGWVGLDVAELITDAQGRLREDVVDKGLLVRSDGDFCKILSSEFSSYARAQTCHSCHGSQDPGRDEGKSENCAGCHARDGVALAGEPALTLRYQPLLFDFVQLSDSHIGRSAQEAENLSAAVAQINGLSPDFVLLSGDLTHRGSVEEYALFKNIMAGLDAPYYCVPGDNDVVDYASQGADLQRYTDQLGEACYAFQYGGVTFIGINNTADLSLDPLQRAWLAGELRNGMPEVVFAHKPLLDLYSNFEPFEEAGLLLDLVEYADVAMYLSGHEHAAGVQTMNNVYHVWCDNLSYAHDGDPYNLYRVYADRIVQYHVDLRDGLLTRAGSFALQEVPLLIELDTFEAVPGRGSVTLRWSTASELDNAGFHIYRSERGGAPVKISRELIAAQGGPFAGADYVFIDTDVRNLRKYTYQLVDIDLRGAQTFHGPVTAVPRFYYGNNK